MESQVNHQQQVLRILTSMNNELAALNRHVAGNDGAVGRNSSVNISNNQIRTFNFNSSGHEIEGPADEVGNNPASNSEQPGEGNRGRHHIIEEHIQLHEAAKHGDWAWAENFFNDHPEMMTVEITNEKETALHIAADHTKWAFVENLVQLMPSEKLELQDSKHGFTALHTAAMEGNTRVAKLMVTRNGALTQIRDNYGRVPLHTAAKYVSDGQTEALKYLYFATNKEVFAGPHGASLLCDLIDSNFYEIELSLLQRFPKLVIEKTDSGVCALEVLVRRPFSFRSGNKTTWWQNLIYPFLQIDTTTRNEHGRSTNCETDTTIPTEVHSSTVCQPDTAAPSHLGNSTVQLDEMASNDISLASPYELGSNTDLQVCRMASNGVRSSTVLQVDTTTPTDLDTILEMDTGAPTDLDNSIIPQAGSMVGNNDFSNRLLQLGETFPNDLDRSTRVLQVRTINSNNLDSSTVAQVDRTAPSDLDRAGTENHLPESSRKFSTMCRGNIMILFLVYLITYLTRVPFIRNLCEQKYINEQAYRLVSIMLEQLDLTMNKSDILDFFKTSSLMKRAITYGTTEVVELSLQKFPYLIWSKMERQTVVQTAIGERNEKVFNFICKKMEEDMDELNHRIDERGDSILHYAANIAPSTQLNLVSGAALQMQREVQWFKAVEFILLERYRRVRNKDGYTAQQIFIDKHKGLVKEGEKWMRDTAQSCMLVATLISTVVFAAVFTVPGGNYNNANGNINGLPILLNKNSFIVFAVADALALFSSVTSILMFLAILTSRYSEEDFLKALPQKFILGLGTLFFSIATMMISFGSAVDIMLSQRLAWIIVPIILLGCMPVKLFLWMLFPLFVEMIHCTYCPTKFHQRTTKRALCYT
ncbi:uncharacterized protein LOC113295764 isoform X2 [Papaver somniferum]|uniref:uncharacterized protein LOC113295764 isoform X2 n=1 Tax=Papaver somniferum TaxID=3469 RepID=UPI000E6FC0D1|nr:uncharacterized protein LOC113295764 isoform X2 [Papaver somniferum]